MADQKTNYEQYTNQDGYVSLSGTQALVRLVVDQARLDQEAGLNTGGFISGYRGSPLGHVDTEMWAAKPLLEERNIHFQSGVNEDLAANAVWGTQQIEFFDGPRVDGAFGLWYGKSPGVDRSCDALRHANLWGTAPTGGVIMAVGDDPMSRSSSIQQQSEQMLAGLCIPTFSASSVQDIYDYGLLGWQLSHYAGVWVAIKMVTDIAESIHPVAVSPSRFNVSIPEDFNRDDANIHTRWPDTSVDQDRRMLEARLPAVKAFARANRLDRLMIDSPNRKLGVLTAGKSYVDTLEALKDLGIDEAVAKEIGLSVYKVGLIWPLEPEGVREFADGLDQILVIEESRPFLETQLKDILYNHPAERQPRVLGKRDLEQRELFPSYGELTPVDIARGLAAWLAPHHGSEQMSGWLSFLEQKTLSIQAPRSNIARTPYFCSGCPHSTSTKVPDGSSQLAGIGCHWMVTLMDREAITYPQMGGEGGTWVGSSPFVETPHVFVNVGDGTYYHSGYLAIRHGIAGKVNATYKILYNDAVAMTGGQPVDGPISVQQIAAQVNAEGASQVAVVSSNPGKYNMAEFPAGTTLHHRDELEQVQRRFREEQGVTIIIYEQTCATELRRRRKRGLVEDPDKRVIINDRVCEGCGDCGVQSNCLSVQPLETEFGRKRVIDQSACNKDFSCVKGFCPSFVTVSGGKLSRGTGLANTDDLFQDLPEPSRVSDESYGLLVAGIGGTGVVTVSNLLGSAAVAEGKHIQTLNLTGLAQKFGAVYCHLKIAERIEDLNATRISYGKANLLIGADIVSSASDEGLSRLRAGFSKAVINDHETVTGKFTRDREFHVPIKELRASLADHCRPEDSHFHDTTDIARLLTGDTIGANVMLLGYACQQGYLPVGLDSLLEAIAANGVAVEYNIQAFQFGRLLAHDPLRVEQIIQDTHKPRPDAVASQSTDQLVERRVADLVDYQDQALAERYRSMVDRVRTVEADQAPGMSGLSEAVARNYYKLLAYKDEYEVARLYTNGDFEAKLKDQFEGNYRLSFHLAPPLISKRDKATGKLIKREFGSWILGAFRMLARFRGLRGTALDIFGYSDERKMERQLIQEYEEMLNKILPGVKPENYPEARQIAALPDTIRGYGHVKEDSIRQARLEQARLLASFESDKIIAIAA